MRVVPKHFDIMGQRINVEQFPNFSREHECYGKWLPARNVIQLQQADENHSNDVVLQTFWHEATHAYLDILGYGEWSSNEVVVEQIGQCIYQILKTKR